RSRSPRSAWARGSARSCGSTSGSSSGRTRRRCSASCRWRQTRKRPPASAPAWPRASTPCCRSRCSTSWWRRATAAWPSRKAFLFLLHPGNAAEAASRLYSSSGKPATIHLERVSNRLSGAVRILGLRLHVLDIDDRATVVDEGHSERDQRVLHRHAVNLGLVEDEEHAGVLRHALAVHEPLRTSARVGDHLGANQVHPGVELRHRMLRQGGRGGEGGECEKGAHQ